MLTSRNGSNSERAACDRLRKQILGASTIAVTTRIFVEVDGAIPGHRFLLSKVLGMDGWEYLRLNPEVATIFDDAMTDFASMAAPAIATAYDFSQWDSIMDVGGGNGVLLAAILQAYPDLTGVLADRPPAGLRLLQ